MNENGIAGSSVRRFISRGARTDLFALGGEKSIQARHCSQGGETAIRALSNHGLKTAILKTPAIALRGLGFAAVKKRNAVDGTGRNGATGYFRAPGSKALSRAKSVGEKERIEEQATWEQGASWELVRIFEHESGYWSSWV
jgi:hypothetical protein